MAEAADAPLLLSGAKRSDLNAADDDLEAGIRMRADITSSNDTMARHVQDAIADLKARALDAKDHTAAWVRAHPRTRWELANNHPLASGRRLAGWGKNLRYGRLASVHHLAE